MVFDNKNYLFESDDVKKKRTRRKILLSALAISFIIVIFPLGHHYYSQRLMEDSREKFFHKSPDLIAVFTGDQGRINRALERSLQHPSSKILISGVYSKNTLIILLKKHFNITEDSQEYIDYFSRIIELDFQAQNTYDNVKMTLKFLSENKTFKNVLIISHDYHLPRIHLALKMMEIKNKDLQIYFEGVKTSNFFEYLRQIFFEQLKIIKLLLF
ncbi:MAG: YdcF family protein [Halobacteriovoraceae bacterium]|nr:YdcF family protein [Halobacteriovoraceae bacterium]MCB9094054.1 YdcF family protein [Halobacteriovoraceae bacterium]